MNESTYSQCAYPSLSMIYLVSGSLSFNLHIRDRDNSFETRTTYSRRKTLKLKTPLPNTSRDKGCDRVSNEHYTVHTVQYRYTYCVDITTIIQTSVLFLLCSKHWSAYIPYLRLTTATVCNRSCKPLPLQGLVFFLLHPTRIALYSR